MITLEKDGKMMEVCSELQASVFERNGYKRVRKDALTGENTVQTNMEVSDFPMNAPETPVEETAATEKPKRRRRRVVKEQE